MSQQVYITDRIYTGVDIDEHSVAIFVSLHPSCISSASRSPQCADGDNSGVCGCMNFRFVTWFISSVLTPPRLPLTAFLPPALQIHPSWMQEKCNPSELCLTLGELQFGDLVGERKAGRTMRCSGHAEFWVAAVPCERWSDRLGKGWSPLCSEPEMGRAWGVCQGGWLENSGLW